MNPPTLTNEQREHARAAAMRARRERAAIRAALREGRASATQVLQSTNDAQMRMKVSDLLRSVPGIGPIRCARILERAGVAPSKRVGGLTSRQRDRLTIELSVHPTGNAR